MFDLSSYNPVHVSIAGVFGVLIIASVIVAIMHLNDPDHKHRELEARVKSWWFMIGIFLWPS